MNWEVNKIEDQTIQALEDAYNSLQQIVVNLYAEADNAVESRQL
ncbi:MAG: hypothetical protein QNJ53_20580 [Pleurocapsa sp. MO_192.B19]|nr:hypothetical protein [Pleurocapsa sp. MO_192.B19]